MCACGFVKAPVFVCSSCKREFVTKSRFCNCPLCGERVDIGRDLTVTERMYFATFCYEEKPIYQRDNF